MLKKVVSRKSTEMEDSGGEETMMGVLRGGVEEGRREQDMDTDKRDER